MVDTQFQTIKLRRSNSNILVNSKTVLQDGEVCLISTSGNTIYDSFVIGNGSTEAKDLGVVPLNIQKGSTFLGIITPDYIPGTPVSSVFYLTSGPGEYHGFGNIKVTKGEVAFIQWLNGGWNKVSVTPLLVDSELSKTSDNPVQNKVVSLKLEELDRLMVKGITLAGEHLQKDGNIIDIPVDEFLSEVSKNPVQNRTVTKKFANLDDWYEI